MDRPSGAPNSGQPRTGGDGTQRTRLYSRLSSIPEDPETVEQVALCKALKDLDKDRVNMARSNRIEKRANLIVAGNLLHAKQGLGVIVPRGVLQPTLVR